MIACLVVSCLFLSLPQIVILCAKSLNLKTIAQRHKNSQQAAGIGGIYRRYDCPSRSKTRKASKQLASRHRWLRYNCPQETKLEKATASHDVPAAASVAGSSGASNSTCSPSINLSTAAEIDLPMVSCFHLSLNLLAAALFMQFKQSYSY